MLYKNTKSSAFLLALALCPPRFPSCNWSQRLQALRVALERRSTKMRFPHSFNNLLATLLNAYILTISYYAICAGRIQLNANRPDPRITPWTLGKILRVLLGAYEL